MAPLVELGAVSAEGDNTLLLAHFIRTGIVLPERGRRTALNRAHVKRAVASLLGINETEIPISMDGSKELMNGLAFPDHGFTRGIFEVHKERVRTVAEAYAMVGRSEAEQGLRRKLEDIEKGFMTCEADLSQIVARSGGCDLLSQKMTPHLGANCKVVLRQDASDQPRVLFKVADFVLKTEYVTSIAKPNHRARQVSEMLGATKDLRNRWDSAAEGSNLNAPQASSF